MYNIYQILDVCIFPMYTEPPDYKVFFSHLAIDDCDGKPCMGDCTYNSAAFQCECDGAKRFNDKYECVGKLLSLF